VFEEEARPRPQRLLDDMSIDELRERVEVLRAEIAAAEAAIARKEATRRAAEAAFGRG
jgi:uncharacterized small protein (DUF1192 family)